MYGQLIFVVSAKIIQQEKKSLCKKGFWDNCIFTYKNMTLDPFQNELKVDSGPRYKNKKCYKKI